MLTASIIIPTRNRPDYLAVTLASIAPQAAEHNAEIIVVDDGSLATEPQPLTTNSPPTNQTTATSYSARYIAHPTSCGPNAARNTGIAAAEADLIVLVDDDIAATPGWLRALLKAAERYPDCDVFGGPIEAQLEGSRLRQCGREGAPITWLDLGDRDCLAEFVWSANMVIRKRALKRVGNFDMSLEIYGDEEEWQRRYKANGGQIHYIAAAQVQHRRTGQDAQLRSLLRANYQRGRHSRRFDIRKGSAPSTTHELRTLAGCLWHTVRRTCGNGMIMSAHSAGRLREALR